MWRQDESGRVHTPLEPLVLAATLALIPVLIVEADASGGWRTAAFVANWLIWAVFAVELAAVLIVATRKGPALRAHLLDVAIVVLTIPLFGQLLSSLRLVRLVRLLRLLRAGVILSRALQAERALTSASTFRFVAPSRSSSSSSAAPRRRLSAPTSSRASGTASGGRYRRSRRSGTATTRSRASRVALSR
jgi:hypothetical protein